MSIQKPHSNTSSKKLNYSRLAGMKREGDKLQSKLNASAHQGRYRYI